MQRDLSKGKKMSENSVGIAMDSFKPNEFKLMAMLMIWTLQSALNICLMFVIKALHTLCAKSGQSVA